MEYLILLLSEERRYYCCFTVGSGKCSDLTGSVNDWSSLNLVILFKHRCGVDYDFFIYFFLLGMLLVGTRNATLE